MTMVKKITVGFVIQNYDEETGICVGQEFVAGDQVDWEDEDEEQVDQPENAIYQPYTMEQPKVAWAGR
jgi:hypothetical protein